MKKPLISIITPCYNSEKYIVETIDSVLSQTYSNFEWIIINDGSTDNTSEIIKSYFDERIKYFYQDNMGQSAASNRGIRETSGEFIKFLDADDIINETHLEELISLADDDSTLVSCGWGRFYNDDLKSFSLEWEDVSRSMDSFEWIKTALSQRHDMMPGWLWLIPKKLMDKVGGWDERFALNNDFEFSVRLLMASKQVVFSPNAIVYYRTNTNTLSTTIYEDSLCNAIESNLLGIGYILERENTVFTRRICANRLQEWAFIAFPSYPKLYRQLKSEIKTLGGSNLKIEGGWKKRVVCFIFGWKLAKKLMNLKIRSHIKWK